ncbi:LptA/OstA family protein [Francisella frigiditurris]|uniref:OstA-like family protein n=1 Tax=Francisella frigiditurris TaxID=1542390 RepID=A0A1J0KV59_9GAMM|nr:LptA/OstA family protein [Francisella frigiditurris]APC97579.1 ostA-like family protein [Francisella frigiditurris]
MLLGRQVILITLFFLVSFSCSVAAATEKDIMDDYGPITICADKLDYNGKKGTLTYLGKVFAMQIKGKQVFCNSSNDQNNNIYFDKHKDKDFTETQTLWLDQAKKVCEQTEECNFITGQSLIVKLGKDRKIETITVTITDDNNFAKFYSYPVEKKSTGNEKGYQKTFKGPIGGQGKEIVYSIVNKKMILKKKAFVTQGGNDYRGDEIDYDMAHDLISIPGSKSQRRSTIVLEGLSEDSKIDLGKDMIIDQPINKDFKNANQVY